MGSSEVGNIVLIEKLLARCAHTNWAVKGTVSKKQVHILNSYSKMLNLDSAGQYIMCWMKVKKIGNTELTRLLPAIDQLVNSSEHRNFSQLHEANDVDQLENKLIAALADLKNIDTNPPQAPSP